MTSFKNLQVDCEDGIATVTLARGPVNAFDQDMYGEVSDLFRNPGQIERAARAIVLRGAGKHFCAGNDLEEFATMTPRNGAERMWRAREAFFAIQFCPLPVVGAVHGVALGTGLALAASCDFVVAAEDARFGLPELTVGVMGGARHLARMAPQPLVRRMFFTGEHVGARDFAAAGASLVVCPADDLLERARAYAQRIAGFSPTAVRLAKQVLNRIENMDIESGYEFEQRFTVKMSGHPDSKEALRSFAERRPAAYRPADPSWTLEA
jgi:enoyl-CoA hydratase/carnithine racemase